MLSSLPLDPAGRFTSKSTDPARRFYPPYTPSSHPRLDAPHVHQVLCNGDEVITCDLGNNVVWRLARDEVAGDGSWLVRGVIDGLAPGDGPRHAVIHPNGKYIYILEEVSSSLTVHTLPPSSDSAASPELLARFSLLPMADRGNQEMIAAEIALLPPTSPENPSLLILTNRNSTTKEGDALALFTVSADGSQVQRAPKPHYHGIGRHIRTLAEDETAEYILTAGRDEGGVVMLQRTGDQGLDLQEVARINLPKVVVAVWM